jgi:CRP-like cAMP-binding protein
MFEDSARSQLLDGRLLSLRRWELLAQLPASELALLARHAREREFRAGEDLVVEGEPVESVLLLLSGAARLTRAGAPTTRTLGELDVVGLLPLAAAIRHLWGVTAEQPIHVLEIDAELMAEVIEDDQALFGRVLRQAAAGAGAAGREALRRAAGHARLRPSAAAASETETATVDAAGRLLLLRASVLFGGAPVDGLAAFAKRLETVQLVPGQEREIAAGELVILGAGCVDLVGATAESTPPSAAAGLAPGAVVGAIEALAEIPARQTVRARTHAQLLGGSLADLLDVIDDHHAMGTSLLRALLALAPSPG